MRVTLGIKGPMLSLGFVDRCEIDPDIKDAIRLAKKDFTWRSLPCFAPLLGATLAKQLTQEPFLGWGSSGDQLGIGWGLPGDQLPFWGISPKMPSVSLGFLGDQSETTLPLYNINSENHKITYS